MATTSPVNSQITDPSFQASRVSIKPLDYLSVNGTVLGHYSTFQRSGEIAATLAANGILASLRWAPASTNGAFCVVEKIRIGLSISADVTSAAIEQAYKATIHRGFSVDFSGANTKLNMNNIANTNAMRKNMGGSLMGANGPNICTTAVMTGNTSTADTNPFAGAVFPGFLVNSNATGTAVLGKAGTGQQMIDLYKANAFGQHPVVLSPNEGVVIQSVLAGFATGTFALYVEWTWAEVELY